MSNRDEPGSAKLPKGAYRLPGGGYVTESRHLVDKKIIIVRAVCREHPDLKQLAKLFLWIAAEMNESEKKHRLRDS